MILEAKVLDYINHHENGVKISDMEEPLGEIRMKLGYVAKMLLDEGKILKIGNSYFPISCMKEFDTSIHLISMELK